MEAMLAAIEHSALGHAMRSGLWLYPLVEIAHIAGFVVLVGAVVVLDLRLLGLSRSVPVASLARHVLPWGWGALLLLVLPSGLALFSAHATEFAANPAFLTKLALIGCAGANALVFHVGTYRGVDTWNAGAPPPLAARVGAALSLALWLNVVACGRLIAYL